MGIVELAAWIIVLSVGIPLGVLVLCGLVSAGVALFQAVAWVVWCVLLSPYYLGMGLLTLKRLLCGQAPPDVWPFPPQAARAATAQQEQAAEEAYRAYWRQVYVARGLLPAPANSPTPAPDRTSAPLKTSADRWMT